MVERTWERFERWLGVNHPALLDDLQPPASGQQLAALAGRIGIALPADFAASLAVHNGQAGRARHVFERYALLSITQLLMCWNTWNDLLDGGDFDGRAARPAAGVQRVWWDRAWIPFATNGGGDYLCIDLHPAAGGTPGQVIEVLHDAPDRYLLAPTFGAWFDRVVDATLHSH